MTRHDHRLDRANNGTARQTAVGQHKGGGHNRSSEFGHGVFCRSFWGIPPFNPAGDLFVVNCTAGQVVKVDTDRRSTVFADSELMACPNGLTFE